MVCLLRKTSMVHLLLRVSSPRHTERKAVGQVSDAPEYSCPLY
jgi:hypothetical protein